MSQQDDVRSNVLEKDSSTIYRKMRAFIILLYDVQKSPQVFRRNLIVGGELLLSFATYQFDAGSIVLQRTPRFISCCHLYFALNALNLVDNAQMEVFVRIFKRFVFSTHQPAVGSFFKCYLLSLGASAIDVQKLYQGNENLPVIGSSPSL
jgi:hypothetical protein